MAGSVEAWKVQRTFHGGCVGDFGRGNRQPACMAGWAIIIHGSKPPSCHGKTYYTTYLLHTQ